MNLKLKSQTVTDYDGNVYQTVTIGNQTWMAENLKTIHYSDGTPLIDGKEFDFYPLEVVMSGSDSTKYFFYYNNDSTYANEYGCLYNWFAAMNGTEESTANPSSIQGVCPAGWHMPSLSEWEELVDFIGEIDDMDWMEGGSTGFNAKLGGTRLDTENGFQGINEMGAYISSNFSINPNLINLIIVLTFSFLYLV